MSFLWSLLVMFQAWGAEPSTCPDILEKRGSIQLQQIITNEGVCFLSVRNFKSSGLVYRNYLFTSDGNLMIFNSFGWGDDSSSTGARDFYMFPRPQIKATYQWNDEARHLEVTDVTGGKSYFSYETAELIQMEKGQIFVDPKVHPDNRGGVEIRNYQGLILDIGWSIGRSPTQNPSGWATFTDSQGQTCRTQNRHLFSYGSDGDVYFKLSDAALGRFLARNCPKVKL